MPRPWAAVAAAVACAAVATAGVAIVGSDTEARAAHPLATAQQPPVVQATQDNVVRPLRRLLTPDAIVRLDRPATAAQLHLLRTRDGVRAIAVVDRGVITIGNRRLRTLGLEPSQARRFTPALTAQSDALWQSIARGELALSYGGAHGLRRHLGDTLTATGRGATIQQLRVGALAAFGLGRAEVVVDRASAHMLGLKSARDIYVAAPHRSRDWIAAKLSRIFGPTADVHSLRPETPPRPAMSDYARATIPADYLARYQSAAGTCPGLPWTVLAGIGAVETWHGSNVHRSSKGAEGPMQFLPSTFAMYGVDADGDGVADIQDPDDAVYSAARYLCLWGAGRGGQALYDAVFAYNHADWYVRRVFAFANSYV